VQRYRVLQRQLAQAERQWGSSIIGGSPTDLGDGGAADGGSG
jgi:hypothetical protein